MVKVGPQMVQIWELKNHNMAMMNTEKMDKMDEKIENFNRKCEFIKSSKYPRN